MPLSTKVPTPGSVTVDPQLLLAGSMMHLVKPVPVTDAGDKVTGVVVIVDAVLPVMVGAGAVMVTVKVAVAV